MKYQNIVKRHKLGGADWRISSLNLQALGICESRLRGSGQKSIMIH